MLPHVQGITYPALNFTACDTSDNFGWLLSGQIPNRAFQPISNGMLCIPGWLSKYDWKGYIPSNEMPSSINCKKGYIVSCNHIQVDQKHYPYYLGSSYASGYRAWRAADMIETKILQQNKDLKENGDDNKEEEKKNDNSGKMGLEYMKEMQLDCVSYCARQFMQFLGEIKDEFNKLLKDKSKDSLFSNKDNFLNINNDIAWDDVRKNKNSKYDYWNENHRSKVEYCWNTLMNIKKDKPDWDYSLTQNSEYAPIWSSLIYCLIRNVICTGIYNGFLNQLSENKEEKEKENDDNNNGTVKEKARELAETVMNKVYNRAFSGLHAFFFHVNFIIIKILESQCENSQNKNKDCYWLKGFENNINLLLYISFIDVYDMMKYWLKTEDKKQWIYGNLHKLTVPHPFSVKLGPKPFNRGPFGMDGGMHTLNMIRPKYGPPESDPFNCQQSGVSVWRQVIDPSNWDNCQCILPMGTSGQVSSPYYDNLLKKWCKGEYIQMCWTDGCVEKNKSSQLTCDPSLPVQAKPSGNCVIL